jgi:hypothetical protein
MWTICFYMVHIVHKPDNVSVGVWDLWTMWTMWTVHRNQRQEYVGLVLQELYTVTVYTLSF